MSRRSKRERAALMQKAQFGKDRPRCTYCASPISRRVTMESQPEMRGGEPTFKFTVDHVVPRARGGRDIQENRTSACEPCNTAKGQDDLVVFIARLGERAAMSGEEAADMQRRAKDACLNGRR